MSANNRGRVLRNSLILLVAVAVVFGLRFRQLGAGEAAASIRSIHETEGVPVEMVVAGLGELAEWITLAGTVEGEVQYPVTSQNALRVVGVPVREGERVEAGDVILRLATGAPSPMYHNLARAQAGYDKALVDVKRLRNLYAEGAVARADLDAAETRLQQLAADLEDAEGSSALRAEQAGTVSSILVVEGETVPVNKPLVWIVATDAVILRFEAGGAQALSLDEDQQAVWIAPDGSAGGFGAVTQLDLMADPATHLLSGEARFDNADGRLVPGLLVSFRVRVLGAENALLVPAGCVRDGALWVVDPERRARRRVVTVGLVGADEVEILDGLRVGEEVVRHGANLLAEGVLVKRIDAGEEH